MPIYEYRCECGDVVEALVRSGREPTTGDEAGHFCDTGGKLVKLISAHSVGRAGSRASDGAYRDSSSGASVSADATCGSCGQTPGSCQDN